MSVLIMRVVMVFVTIPCMVRLLYEHFKWIRVLKTGSAANKSERMERDFNLQESENMVHARTKDDVFDTHDCL